MEINYLDVLIILNDSYPLHPGSIPISDMLSTFRVYCCNGFKPCAQMILGYTLRCHPQNEGK